MNLFADEGVERQIVERLRLDGHFVHYIAEMDPGISDDTVLKKANDHNALLLTEDKDFGELVFRQKKIAAGVVLLRLSGISIPAKIESVSAENCQYPSRFRIIPILAIWSQTAAMAGAGK